MLTKRQEITFLNTLITLSSQTYRYANEMKQVVELFKERKIPTKTTARKILDLLGSTNKKTNIKGLERFEEYTTAETLIGRLTRNTKPTKNFVKGTIKITDKYVQVRRGQITDYGIIYHRATPHTYEIEAKTKAEAEEKINS